MKEEPQTQADTRSRPLKNTYNSTFVLVVLVIAAVVAAILMLWPSGGF